MRERVLDAALKLFVEEGYEKTTMRRIADVIEYTPGAIYSYFKDKSEICFALHHLGFEKLNAMTAAALKHVKQPFDRLYAVGQTYIHFALANRALYDLMFISRETGRSIVEAAEWAPGAQAYATLHDSVAAFHAHFGLDWDIDTVAFACWGLVHGLVSLVVCDRCTMIPDAQHAGIVEAGFRHQMNILRTAAEALQRDEHKRGSLAPTAAPEAVKEYHAKLRAVAAAAPRKPKAGVAPAKAGAAKTNAKTKTTAPAAAPKARAATAGSKPAPKKRAK